MERSRLEHMPWTWTLIKGEMHNVNLQHAIVQALVKRIRGNNKRRCILYDFLYSTHFLNAAVACC